MILKKSSGRVFAVILIIILAGTHSAWAQSGTVLAAAASSMKFAFEELTGAFHKEHPSIRVKLSFGSSGNFYSQIKNGAPHDIYFSADTEYPRLLEEEGFGQGDLKVTPYAVGRIVLWSSHRMNVDSEKEKMDILLSPKILKFAIANPQHAPYGRAAIEALRHFKILESIESRLVMGENVSQTAQFTHTGAAQAGIIALSLALTPQMSSAGTYWLIPMQSHQPIEQGYLILRNSRNPVAAKVFADYVTGPKGAVILRQHGFGVPGEME